MYKVFVNEKKLSIGSAPRDGQKSVHYDGAHTAEMALDLLENTSCPELTVYGDEPEKIWADFRKSFKIIEAAGGIVSNQDGKILFIHRIGKWDLPKGKLEKGESTEQAALREVEEETALGELKVLDFINSTYHVYTERGGEKVLKTTYWYRMDYLGTQDPRPQTEEGITQAGWKSRSEIVEQVLPETFRNIRLILSEAGLID